MSVRVSSNRIRELLSKAIVDEIKSWPAVDRQVFVSAHYKGKRPEEIGRSFGLEVDQVRQILQQRELTLRTALRSFRDENSQNSDIPLQTLALTLEECLG
jgi:DNA-directed RNA polymerase specialized sigma24 family protein